MNPVLSHLYSLPDNIQSYWASPENPEGKKGAGALSNKGRKGRPCLPLKSGEQTVLAQASGQSGMVHRIWITIDKRWPAVLRGLRIDMYWDGATTPAVSAPFGDFFGQSLGRCQTFESALFSNPENRSFNCHVPMPFRSGFRIVVTNESEVDIAMLFYDVNYTLGDEIAEPSYFHAHWRREAPTTLGRDFEILPKVNGRGRYLGATFSVIVDQKTYFDSWWGEGECKLFIDGDGEHPTLVGTGVEDYIGTAWGQGQYTHLYQGCHIADAANGQYGFYRLHLPDPIYFQRDVRVTFQQIGGAPTETIHKMRDAGLQLIACGGAPAGTPLNMNPEKGAFPLFEREDDWSSCGYFYLDRSTNDLPALAPVAERTKGLLETTVVSTVGVA